MDDKRRFELLLLLERERLAREGLVYLLELRESALSLGVPIEEVLELLADAQSAKHGMLGEILKKDMLPNPKTHLALLSSDHVRPLEEIERQVLCFAVEYYDGQMSEVARRLKIGRSTLYRKLNGFGISTKEPEDPYELA